MIEWIEHPGHVLVLICIAGGFLGAFLPLAPGCTLMWLGFLAHKLCFGARSMGWFLFVIITGLVLVAQIVDWAFTYWGVRKFGGTWRGGLGAVAGLIIGPILGSMIPGLGTLLGFILGPILGAVAGELLGGKTARQARNAAFGTILGGLVAYVVRIFIATILLLIYIFSLFPVTQPYPYS